MLTQADVTVSRDGDVLITLEPSGMNPGAETEVSLIGGVLRLAQRGNVFVEALLDDRRVAQAIARAMDIVVAEADEVGFVIFGYVRRV